MAAPGCRDDSIEGKDAVEDGLKLDGRSTNLILRGIVIRVMAIFSDFPLDKIGFMCYCWLV